MENFIQSDIFFFITSIAVVIITISILVVLWYVIRILKNIKDVSEIVKRETIFFSGDLSGIRKKIKKLFDFLIKTVSTKIRNQRK